MNLFLTVNEVSSYFKPSINNFVCGGVAWQCMFLSFNMSIVNFKNAGAEE